MLNYVLYVAAVVARNANEYVVALAGVFVSSQTVDYVLTCGRNLTSVSVKMFPRLICFKKRFYKLQR